MLIVVRGEVVLVYTSVVIGVWSVPGKKRQTPTNRQGPELEWRAAVYEPTD